MQSDFLIPSSSAGIASALLPPPSPPTPHTTELVRESDEESADTASQESVSVSSLPQSNLLQSLILVNHLHEAREVSACGETLYISVFPYFAFTRTAADIR